MKALLLAAMLPVFALYARPAVTVGGVVTGLDKVEREVRLSGQRRPFVLAFSTVQSVRGVPVPPEVFWRTARVGMTVTVRSRNYGPFHIVDRISVR